MVDSVSGFTKLAQGRRGRVNAGWRDFHAGSWARLSAWSNRKRALALHRAQSSKEIRERVQNTADALAGCSSRAQRAGEAMLAITGSSAQVEERILRITEAARSQADGLAQVGRTLADLQLDSAA